MFLDCWAARQRSIIQVPRFASTCLPLVEKTPTMHAGTPLIAGSSQLTLAKWASINNAPWCKPCYTRTFKRESEPDAALAKSDEELRVSVSRPRHAHASSTSSSYRVSLLSHAPTHRRPLPTAHCRDCSEGLVRRPQRRCQERRGGEGVGPRRAVPFRFIMRRRVPRAASSATQS